MLLHAFLEPMEITQKQFAEHLGWTYARLNEIVNGKRGITAESALTLGDAFEMESEFWLNLQKNWDLWNATQKHKRVRSIGNLAKLRLISLGGC